MAARKQLLHSTKMNPKTRTLLERAKGRELTEEELREQRISFAFGNAPVASDISKESVRHRSKHVRLVDRA